MVETGHVITEVGVITRVAEAAITFQTGVLYAPVIQGTAADQVLAATDSAATVIGFVKKPMTADLIATGDTVDVITEGSIIKQYVSGTVAVNDPLEVHSTVTQLAKLTVADGAATAILKRCANVVSPRTNAGVTWVRIKGGY